MTPEEKFNQDIWYVLQEIKKKSLYAADNKSVSYEIDDNIIVAGHPSAKEEGAILIKLQQQQGIKIINKKVVLNDYGLESGTTYFLEILQPKFDDFYEKYNSSKNSSPPTKYFFSDISFDNLIKIQKVLKIVLAELEIQKTNILVGNKVFIKKFEDEKIYYTDAKSILNRIDGIEVLNDKFNQIYEKYEEYSVGINPSYTFGITKEDLAQHLLWTGSSNLIREARKEVNEKIESMSIENVALLKKKNNTIATSIKNIRLDEQSYLLEINKGDKILYFKSKKQVKKLDDDLTQKEREELEKETLKTKQWKILSYLWEFRWELKDDMVLKKGDFTSLGNLATASGSESTGAAYKQIQRLNKRFKENGVAIEIKGENEKYRLIVNKA